MEESVRTDEVPPGDCTDNPLSPRYAHVAYRAKYLKTYEIQGSPQIDLESLWITQNGVIPALIEGKWEDHQGDHRDNPHPVSNRIFASPLLRESLDTTSNLSRVFTSSTRRGDLLRLDITSYRDNVRIRDSFRRMIFPQTTPI